jgi:hypothetical protein
VLYHTALYCTAPYYTALQLIYAEPAGLGAGQAQVATHDGGQGLVPSAVQYSTVQSYIGKVSWSFFSIAGKLGLQGATLLNKYICVGEGLASIFV